MKGHYTDKEVPISLATLNDDGFTFDQIADVIDWAISEEAE